MLCRSFVVRRTVTFHHNCHRYPSPIHRLGINCLTAPFPYSTPTHQPIIPCPFAPFYSSLRSILPYHYSLFSRQYEPLHVTVREVLITLRSHSANASLVFPISLAIPPPTFSFVLEQSGSSKSFLHRPFISPLCPHSPLITNQLDTFSHSKFLSSPTPSTSPRCSFNLPSPTHLTSLLYPVQLLFSTFFSPIINYRVFIPHPSHFANLLLFI